MIQHDPQPVAMRILVVDDARAIRCGLSLLLEQLGCRVDTAGDGGEALRAATAMDYDLIFLDCTMPVMNGFDAARAIRNVRGARGRVPIVGMTVGLTAATSMRGRDAGMSEVIEKLTDPASFESTLRRWTAVEHEAG